MAKPGRQPPRSVAVGPSPAIPLSWVITRRCDVTDVLVRDVPEDVIAALDARAARLGLSRSEYLRRRLTQEAVSGLEPVTVEHLERFADTFRDLANAEVRKDAWE